MLTSVFPPLNPHLRQNKQTNAYLPASPYGCLSALILIVDRTCSAGEVDEMRRGGSGSQSGVLEGVPGGSPAKKENNLFPLQFHP